MAGYPEETNAPYGLRRRCCWCRARAYRQEYGYNAIHLLPVNLYGPHDKFDLKSSHVIPAVIRKMVDAQESGAGQVTLFGDGSPTREFLSCATPPRALCWPRSAMTAPKPVNLGSAFEISIRDLVEIIADEVGFTGELRWDTSQPNGQPRRKLDVSRAQREFGFVSQTDFRAGLRETIRWFRAEGRREQPSAAQA